MFQLLPTQLATISGFYIHRMQMRQRNSISNVSIEMCKYGKDTNVLKRSVSFEHVDSAYLPFFLEVQNVTQ